MPAPPCGGSSERRFAKNVVEASVASRSRSLARAPNDNMKILYYETYREAIARARRLAKEQRQKVRIGRGRDERAPNKDFYVVTDGPRLPDAHVIATVDQSGHVEMSGARYYRMVSKRSR